MKTWAAETGASTPTHLVRDNEERQLWSSGEAHEAKEPLPGALRCDKDSKAA